MNKIKVCPKVYLFIIISSVLIAVGMIVGAICHSVSGAKGFFNYGGEFSSYSSVTITYDSLRDVDTVKPVCEEVLKQYKPYEISYAETRTGGEIIYKYHMTERQANEKLAGAVKELNERLYNEEDDEALGVATVLTGAVNEGGARAVKRTAIALASAAAFVFVYFVLRYKLRAAFSALLACLHNVGLVVALAAITRVPVGTELSAICAAAVLLTVIFSCLFFDRVRKNFKSDKYTKASRSEVVEISAAETRVPTLIGGCALIVASLIVGAMLAISSLAIDAFAPVILAVFATLSCCYGAMFFTPAVHAKIDALCQKIKTGSKDKKAAKPAKVSASVKEEA